MFLTAEYNVELERIAVEFTNGSYAARILLPFIRCERPDGPYFVLSEAVQDAYALHAIPAGLFTHTVLG